MTANPLLEAVLFTVLLSIPENVLKLFLVVSLQGARVEARRLLAYGAIAGIVLTALRALPLSFGWHVPLHAVFFLLLVKSMIGGSWAWAVLGTLVAQLVIVVGEGLVALPVMSAMSVPLDRALSDPAYRLAGGWLSDILLIVACAVFFFRGRAHRVGWDRPE